MADGTSALHFSMSTLPYLLPVLRCCDSASAFLVSAVGSYALHGCGCSSAAPEEDPSLAVSGYAPALHFCPHVDANVIALPYGEETKNIEPGQPMQPSRLPSHLYSAAPHLLRSSVCVWCRRLPVCQVRQPGGELAVPHLPQHSLRPLRLRPRAAALGGERPLHRHGLRGPLLLVLPGQRTGIARPATASSSRVRCSHLHCPLWVWWWCAVCSATRTCTTCPWPRCTPCTARCT